MSNSQKTVFISYRRSSSAFIARAIYEHLKHSGYDVFMDVESIDSGKFDTIILNQIAARAHFILILTERALERCVDEGDWLRREIEAALDLERNIVPIAVNNFNFDANATYLQGKLAQLPGYNALDLPHSYFEAAMERLKTRFLKQTTTGTVQPTPAQEHEIVQAMIDKADDAPLPNQPEMSLDDYFARGLAHYEDENFTQSVADFSMVIDFDSNNADAYAYRARAHWKLKSYDDAISDCNEALQLDPKNVMALNYRGNSLCEYGDINGAIADYTMAIRLQPDFALAYLNLGVARYNQGDLAEAIANFDQVIHLQPDYPTAYLNRANTREDYGDLEGALADYSEVIRLEPHNATAYFNRAWIHNQQENFQSALNDYQTYLDLGEGVKAGDQAYVEMMITDLKDKLGQL